MAHRVHSGAAAFLCLGLFSLPAAVGAQAGFTTFQFSFSNPGARSLGFGGAFVALADDATAAFANPAGLVQILEPEASVEIRSWGFSTPYTAGGRLNGEPSGFGLDTVAGLRFADSQQEAAGLSFLSVVYPRNRWSFAFHRHVLANFEFAGETQGLFAVPYPPDTGFRRERDRRSATEYDIVGHGLTAAWRATDSLSVGLGWVYFDVGLRGTEQLFSYDSPDRFFERNSYLPERNVENLVFGLDDHDWGLTAGFLWSPKPGWHVGGVFRQGPKGEGFSVEVLSGPGDPAFPPGTSLARVSSPLAFPDTYGLGGAYRAPGDRLTVSFEWDRVEYSTIVESLSYDNEAALDDADELHAGVELVFLDRHPVVALRAGAWLDPDHRIRVEGSEAILDQAQFQRGTDEVHWSAGVGLAFRRLQIDVGVDISSLVNTLSLSTIYGLRAPGAR